VGEAGDISPGNALVNLAYDTGGLSLNPGKCAERQARDDNQQESSVKLHNLYVIPDRGRRTGLGDTRFDLETGSLWQNPSPKSSRGLFASNRAGGLCGGTSPAASWSIVSSSSMLAAPDTTS